MKIIEAWSTPPARPAAPEPGELHIWLIDLNIPPANFECSLTREERDRACRMLNAAGSRRFVTARGCLRKVLGDYLATDAGSIGFRYGSVGKPEIAHPRSHLRFNLSHSGDLALLAVTNSSEIGIDIEPLTPRTSLSAIAGKVFGHNIRDTLAALDEPQRTLRFFQMWTTLEARAKCSGNGVFSRPDSTIHAVNFAPKIGWTAAVAVARGVPGISKWRTYRLTPADF